MHLQDTAGKDDKLLFSVVDLHAITLPQGRGELRRWKREALGMLLAVGIREDRSTVFFQSQVCLMFVREGGGWGEGEERGRNGKEVMCVWCGSK